MDGIGTLLLLLGALVIGVIGQKIRLLPRASGWVTGTVAAAIGEFAGSELLGTSGSWGPEVGGFIILPALVAGTIFAVVADVLTRLLTPGPLGWHAEELKDAAPGPIGPAPRLRRRAGPTAAGRAGGGGRGSTATAHRG